MILIECHVFFFKSRSEKISLENNYGLVKNVNIKCVKS